MKNYPAFRKAKLAEYKSKYLTKGCGFWRNRSYDHILPVGEGEKNILRYFRDDFWIYFKKTGIKLHPDFHHLNSSQALCFNLFFPLFHYEKRFLTYVLHRIFEVPSTYFTPIEDRKKLISMRNVHASDRFAKELEDQFMDQNSFIDVQFEKILNKPEFTNFDFFVQLKEGHKVLFEIKYTEPNFKGEKNDATHNKKYHNIYRPKLENILRPEFLTEDFVFANYQIIRNLSYIDDITTVIFLFPAENQQLEKTEKLINEILLPERRLHVRVVYLEDLVSTILNASYLDELQPIFEDFKLKYID
jgi:hypothetical protein